MKILGKEEMLVKLAEQFKTKILVSKPRYDRYVNVLNMNKACFTYEKLIDTFIYASDDDLDQSLRLEYTNVAKIYIKPTALEFSARKLNDLKRCIEIYSQLNNTYFSIPYSDHSSYSEIIEFVKKLNEYFNVADPDPLGSETLCRSQKSNYRYFVCQIQIRNYYFWIRIQTERGKSVQIVLFGFTIIHIFKKI